MSLTAATEELVKAQEELEESRSKEGEQVRKLKKETAKLRKEQERYEKSMRQTVREMSFADLGKQLRNDILAPITGFLNRAPNFVKTLGMMFMKPFVGGVKKSTETIAGGPASTTETIAGAFKQQAAGQVTEKIAEKLPLISTMSGGTEATTLDEIKEILEHSKYTLDEMLRLHKDTWQTTEDIHAEALKENAARKKSKVDSSVATEKALETRDASCDDDGEAPSGDGIFGKLGKAFKAIGRIVKKFLKWKAMLILLLGSVLLGLAMKFWEPIKEKVGEIKDWLVDTLFPAISDFVENIVMPIAIKVKDWVMNTGLPTVIDFFLVQLDLIRDLADNIVARFEGWGDMSFKEKIFAILGVFEDLGTYVMDTARNMLTSILDLFGVDGEAMAKKYFDPIRDAISAVVDWIKLVFTDPVAALAQLWEGIGNVARWIWDHTIGAAFTWFGEKLSDLGEAISAKWAEWFPNGILSWIWDNTLGAVFSWIGEKLGNMADAISTKWNETFPEGILGWIWNPIQESMNSIGDFFANIFDIDWAGLLSSFLPDKVAKWLMGESDPLDKAVESGLYEEIGYGSMRDSKVDRSKVKDAPTAQLQAILDDDDISKDDKKFIEAQLAQRKAGAGAAGIAPRDESATDIDAAVAERKKKSKTASAMRGMEAADETSIGGAPIEKLREMGHDDLADRAVPDENGNLWLHGQDAREAARILAPQYEREATAQGQIIQSNVSSEPGSQGPHSSVVAPPPTTAQAANALYNRPSGMPRRFGVTDASTNVTSSSSNSNTNYTIVNRMPARAYDPHTTAQNRRFRGRGGSGW